MSDDPRHFFRLAPQFQPSVRVVGLDVDNVFTHPDIKPWRTIADRQNCTLDFKDQDGRAVRWHVKRYFPVRGRLKTPAEQEVAGITLLQRAGIPTVPLVGWGVLADRRSFVIIEDLVGHGPADKLIGRGPEGFLRLLEPTAELAAQLHTSGLHHRDLYLCHFFAICRLDELAPDADLDLRLIDCARVRKLPRFFGRTRWVVKDLAQFWYSTRHHEGIDDSLRERWLRWYCKRAGVADVDRLRRRIERKVNWIARHDVKLNRAQPNRNISIPTGAPRGA